MTNFAEATTHGSHSSTIIPTQVTIVDISLTDSGVQTAGKYCNKRFKNCHEEQTNSFCADCEEYHQSLLRETILCPHVSCRIFSYLEPNDTASAAQFAFFHCTPIVCINVLEKRIAAVLRSTLQLLLCGNSFSAVIQDSFIFF